MVNTVNTLLSLVSLDPAIYEMVLFDFLKTDVDGFLKYIRLWSSDLYNLGAVVNVVIGELLTQVMLASD